MIKSETYIKEMFEGKSYSEDLVKLYVSPSIPQKIAVNAAGKICGGEDPAKIIVVIDSSIFGNGKEGVAFTGTDMYIKEAFENVKKVSFEDVESASYDQKITKNEDGSTKTDYVLTVKSKNDEIKLSYNKKQSYRAAIADLLNSIKDEVEVIESKNHFAKLEDMGEKITFLYLQIITAYLKADDGIIDTKEYKELMSLMARIKVSKELAEKLRESRLSHNAKLDYCKLIEELDDALDAEKTDPLNIHQSLFFDLLGTRGAKEKIWETDKDLAKIKELLGITDKAAEFGLENLNKSKELINNRLTDSQFKDVTKELGALAGGAGVAIGALAITGGGSITTGLITLAVASTGGMLLGLAVIGGVGYGAYKSIKYFSGTSELEKSGIRIEALRAALENNKATVAYIIEDINNLNNRIKSILDEMNESKNCDDEIEELLNLNGFISNLSGSAMEISAEDQRNEYEINIAKLPIELPKSRYEQLVKNSVNVVEINKLVYEVYKEEKIEINNGPDVEPTVNTIYKRDEELNYETADKLCKAFESIGMYDTKTSAAASASAAVNSAKSFVKGLFG